MSQSNEPMSVCLLVGSSEVADWYANALTVMVENTNAELECIIIAERPTSSPADDDGGTTLLPNSLIESILSSFTSEILETRRQTKIPLREHEHARKATEYHCTLQTHDGLRVAIPEETVTNINEQCDVILHYGVGILTGEILHSTKHGVLSFHHGNLREYRGGPPGFWEFMHDCLTATTTLQRLSETLDGGEIVVEKQIDISGARSWNEVSNRLCAASIDILATGIECLQDSSCEPTQLSDSDLGTLYSTSDMTTRIKLKYVMKEVRCRIAAALRS